MSELEDAKVRHAQMVAKQKAASEIIIKAALDRASAATLVTSQTVTREAFLIIAGESYDRCWREFKEKTAVYFAEESNLDEVKLAQ